MPNRILKESICTSDSVDQLSLFAEVMFYRLIVNCDDYGRMDGRGKILRSRLFPLRTLSDDTIEAALLELEEAELITLYTVNDRRYIQLKSWDKHQQVRARKSKYPASDDNTCNQMISDDYKCPRNPIQSESYIQSESESESNINMAKEKKRRQFTPPTVEEIEAYCDERGVYLIDPQRFVDYYETRGWELSKGRKMVDWRAAVRLWERNEKQRQRETAEVDMPY